MRRLTDYLGTLTVTPRPARWRGVQSLTLASPKFVAGAFAPGAGDGGAVRRPREREDRPGGRDSGCGA